MPPLICGRLVRRYKRFLADVVLDTGEKVTAHCPNSGSMKGCAVPGSRVWLSCSDNPARKYRHTWELVEINGKLAGINTLVPNRLVKTAVENGRIEQLSGYESVRSEVRTSAHTRLDLVLEKKSGEKCYVEIKNCTLMEDSTAMFPDAVTVRGSKHLDELCRLVECGHMGVIFFLIQRMGAERFMPARHIDDVYAGKLRHAEKAGVRILAMDTLITPEQIVIRDSIPVCL